MNYFKDFSVSEQNMRELEEENCYSCFRSPGNFEKSLAQTVQPAGLANWWSVYISSNKWTSWPYILTESLRAPFPSVLADWIGLRLRVDHNNQ